MIKINRPFSKYDIGYEISWHDGVGRYVATFQCETPDVKSSYLVLDDQVIKGNGHEPYLYSSTEHLLYINFLQLVKQLDVPAQAGGPATTTSS